MSPSSSAIQARIVAVFEGSAPAAWAASTKRRSSRSPRVRSCREK
jgi:hypothetical protein